jgi:hypothetical protein
LKFFEGLKKQLKKAETLINFDSRDVGHLIPLTVGHENKPTELEICYIKRVMGTALFEFNREEYVAISPSPAHIYKSSLLPKI